MIMPVEIIGPALACVHVLIVLIASSHVVLYKRDSRAAIAWTGLIWLAPFVGTLLYILLGINRIERRARPLWADHPITTKASGTPAGDVTLDPETAGSTRLVQLSHLVRNVTELDLTFENDVEPFAGGNEAYPAMLEAIREARHTIGLSTYIFDADETGLAFATALQAAVKRGVKVCVLVDAIGAKLSHSSIIPHLEQLGVPVRTFNPPLVRWRFRYANLRNHRKILTVDGTTAFTGGLNIRGSCVSSPSRDVQVNDLHFRLRGPVVKHVQDTFVSDWVFASDEQLSGDGWYPMQHPAGNCAARGVVDGPDEQLDRLRLTLLGACHCAEKSLRIITPYFLPDAPLISALNVAALRGVSVEILIPQKSNERLVEWACNAQLWQLVNRGCQIRRTQPPFDHSKLMLVDDEWALLGSANWDPRSLRLNFEFNVECYNKDLTRKLHGIFESKKSTSSLVTIEELQSRSFPIKLRDGVARLASPFL